MSARRPAPSLPVEIILMIFELVRDEDESEENELLEYSYPRRSNLELGRVCRSWLAPARIMFLDILHITSLNQWDRVTMWSIENPDLATIVTWLTVNLNMPWIEQPELFHLWMVTDPNHDIQFQSNENPPALDIFPNAVVVVHNPEYVEEFPLSDVML